MFKKLVLTAAALGFAATAAFAEGDLTRANVQKVVIEMGTDADGNMYFAPNHFDFETGVAYDWVLVNKDPYKHELSIGEMFERIFTRKVEVTTPDDEMIAEIKGAVREVEVGANQTVEWFFVPLQPGDDIEISCQVEGHYEAGMHGTVTIH